MPKEYSRADRVADAIQRELAQLVREELRDPRLGIVNITAVEVSKDMTSAKVFVNFVAGKSDAEADAAVEVLNNAQGFLRTQLAKLIRLRIVPRLRFYYDASGQRGQKLSALIDYALSQDREKHSHDDGEDA
jgi:ribosome-binding factor A